ncbi:hypothetical protein ACFPMF_19445 [Larkinella bovis]|uniref:Uncharacterized protein n=1 Tax=Larkinella bovis TaxID=683041 RepID=A0ABW0IDD4_9BACT
MGFWSNAWESIKSTVSKAYRAFADAVSTVGSKVVKATKAVADYVGDKVGKAIEKVGEFFGWARNKFEEGYNRTRSEVDQETAAEIAELRERDRINRINKQKEEQVKAIFRDTIQKLIGIQYENQGENSLEIFQNYTRHYVSAKFLQDLVSQREEIRSPDEIDLVFLELIQKFLTNSISDPDLLDLDKQIQQQYDGKDLLIIGTEALAGIWQHQGKALLKELKGLNKQLESAKIELTTKADRIERLEKTEPEAITDEERNEVEALRKSIETLKIDISDRKAKEASTTEMKNILNGIHFVFQHENDPHISTSMREEAIWVGSMFVEWQDSNIPPAEHERSKMRQFGLAAESLMRDMGASGTINVG